MDKIELEILSLSHSVTQNHSYAIILGEIGGSRRIPIVIGATEAQSIAVGLEKIEPARPLAHDLFVAFMNQFQISLVEVVIFKLVEGVFHSKMVCSHQGQNVDFDSRTSDALAIAVRVGCPIFTLPGIISAAGIVVNDEKIEEKEESSLKTDEKEAEQLIKEIQSDPYKNATDDELKEMLQHALDKEDYEKAARIRDEMNTRNL